MGDWKVTYAKKNVRRVHISQILSRFVFPQMTKRMNQNATKDTWFSHERHTWSTDRLNLKQKPSNQQTQKLLAPTPEQLQSEHKLPLSAKRGVPKFDKHSS